MEKCNSLVHGHILHMRSLRDEPNGSTTCNDADPCPTLRTRVHRLSLTASLDAQTGTQVHTGLSSRLSPHLMAPVYGHAMAVLACPDRCAGPTGHSPHDGLQSLCPMGRCWVPLAGVCGACAASCCGATPRPEPTPWRRDQHRGQKRAMASAMPATSTRRARKSSPLSTIMAMS